MTESKHGQKDESMGEWTGIQMNKWIDKWKNGQILG